MTNTNFIYIIMTLLAASLLGLIATIVDYLYQAGFAIQDITNVQYGFAVVLLWLVVLPVIRRQRLPKGRDWWFLVGTGITAGITNYFYFTSLTMLPVSLSIILLFQFTWMVTLIDMTVKKKMPSAQKWIGMIVILVGTFFAVGLLGAEVTVLSPLAILFGLLAAFCFALSLYLPEFMSNDSTPLLRTAIMMTISAISLFPVFPPTYLTSGVLWNGLFGWGLLMGLIGQVIPFLFLLISIPRIGGRMAGVLGSIELPVTVFAAFLILNESVTWIRWLGVFLIIIGICISELRLSKRPKYSISKI